MVAVLKTHTDREEASPRSAAQAADLLAMAAAALEGIGRAMRSAPEVRESRVMSRWPLALEDVLFELEPMATETALATLSPRLGVSVAQVRSAALRLQRMGLVRVGEEGVSLTVSGRQKLARLQAARAAVLRRLAGRLSTMSSDESNKVMGLLEELVGRADTLIEDQLGDTRDAEMTLRLSR